MHHLQYGLITIATILHYSCIFLACQVLVSCKSDKSGQKLRNQAGICDSKKKPGVPRCSDLPPVDDVQEDTFDNHKPKFEEAQRAKELKGMDIKALNKGEYKTWNRLMVGDDDFEKPIPKKRD